MHHNVVLQSLSELLTRDGVVRMQHMPRESNKVAVGMATLAKGMGMGLQVHHVPLGVIRLLQADESRCLVETIEM